MPTKDELKAQAILDWQDYKSNFKDANLLLGNGFSIKFSDSFKYTSLFDSFLSKIDPKDKAIFEQFGTSNFELIQEIILNAIKVNTIFGLPTKEISESKTKLQEGLITTIQANHPRNADIDWDQLREVSETFDQFKNIFTLNYDLFLYHIILLSNDRHREDNTVRPYQDYFWSQYNSTFLEFMDYQNYKHYKHVYYLHGSLFLFKHHLTDLKLRKNHDKELVEILEEKISTGDIPLFVCEGTSEDKINTINRSNYLSFANSKLKEDDSVLAIYGVSLSDQDNHIVDAINRKNKQIAYFIYVGSKSIADLNSETHAIQSKLPRHDITFFDSSTLFDF